MHGTIALIIAVAAAAPTAVVADHNGAAHAEPLCPAPDEFDSDGDGLADGFEVAHGLDPCHPDSDGDLMPDGYEDWYLLVPQVPDGSLDSDQDGVANVDEYCYPMGIEECGTRTLQTFALRTIEPCWFDPEQSCTDGVYWDGTHPRGCAAFEMDGHRPILCEGGIRILCKSSIQPVPAYTTFAPVPCILP